MPALLATTSASIKPGEMLMYGNEFPIGNKFLSSFVMVKKWWRWFAEREKTMN